MFEDTPISANASAETPVDPRRLTPAERVALAVRYARELASLEARNLELHAAIAERDNTSIRIAGRSIENPASDELATELHISSRAATNNLHRADTVSRFLPRTLTSHLCGDLSSAKVRIITEELPPEWQVDADDTDCPQLAPAAEHGSAFVADSSKAGRASGTTMSGVAVVAPPSTHRRSPREARRLLEELVLPQAPKQTPHEFRRSVRRAIARIDTGLANETARVSRRDRGVNLYELPHGIALLEATLTLEEGRTAYDLLTRNARIESAFLRTTLAETSVGTRSVPATVSESDTVATPGEPLCNVTLDSLRADMLIEALANSGAGHPDTTAGETVGPSQPVGRNRIAAVIDLPTLLGLADNPAEIPGYGPVPATVARQLAGDAQWERWVTDPTSGHLLDVGRRRYTPPAALRDYLAARDGVCRFPGCSRDASAADQDHVIAWEQGGPTCAGNLGSLCRRHHRLKTAGTWKILQSRADGSCTWQSPNGSIHVLPPNRILTSPVPPSAATQQHGEQKPPETASADPPPF